MEELLSLSPIVLAAIAVLAVVQIGLEVWAIVDIVRRPTEQIVGENKLLWVLLVLFVNLIGAIVYLTVGRRQQVVEGIGAAPATGAATERAIDALYGERKADE